MDQDLAPDSIYWAKELLNVEPEDPDAHYVLAAEALEERTPNVPEIKRHLEVLGEEKAPPVRRLWIRARLADLTGDDAARDAAFAEARSTALGGRSGSRSTGSPGSGSPSLEIRCESRWRGSPARSRSSGSRSRSWASPRNCPRRGSRGSGCLLEQTQRALTARSAKLPADGKKAVDGLVDAIEVDLESIFKQALAEGRQPDLQTYLSYADHLRFRRQRDRCLEVDRPGPASRRRRRGEPGRSW